MIRTVAEARVPHENRPGQDRAMQEHWDHWENEVSDPHVLIIEPVIVNDGNSECMLSIALWDWDRAITRADVISLWNRVVGQVPGIPAALMAMAISEFMREHVAARQTQAFITTLDGESPVEAIRDMLE